MKERKDIKQGLLAEAGSPSAGRRGPRVPSLRPHLVDAIRNGLAAERQALGLLNDLVVHARDLGRHNNVTLQMRSLSGNQYLLRVNGCIKTRVANKVDNPLLGLLWCHAKLLSKHAGK